MGVSTNSIWVILSSNQMETASDRYRGFIDILGPHLKSHIYGVAVLLQWGEVLL